MKNLSTDISTAPNSLFLALELSNSRWELCLSQGKRFRRRSILAGDQERFLKEIQTAKEKLGLSSDCPVHSCYEAGRDGFWIHHFLVGQGIDNRVFDSASIEVNRRSKQRKTDKMDAEKLVRLLMRIVLGGEKRVCAVLRIPTLEQERQMRLDRERERLVKERVAHRNRIRSLLKLHGIRVIGSVDKLKVTLLKDWKGDDLPEALREEIQREQQRLQLLSQQIKTLETQQEEQLKNPTTQGAKRAAKLMSLRALGPQSAWLLSHEFFWRDFKNRKEVGACSGLCGSPYDSGDSQREQGISKAGSPRVRALSIELAWNWVRYQPDSYLTQWFKERFGQGKRHRRIGIVALARKLLIALWKYLQEDLMPLWAKLRAV